jgi:hypothetical protein
LKNAVRVRIRKMVIAKTTATKLTGHLVLMLSDYQDLPRKSMNIVSFNYFYRLAHNDSSRCDVVNTHDEILLTMTATLSIDEHR